MPRIATLTVIIALALVFTAAAASAETQHQYQIDVWLGDNLYSFTLSVSTEYIEPLSTLNISGRLLLTYASGSKPVFVVLDVKAGNITLTSIPLGIINPANATARKFSVYTPVPREALNGRGFVDVELRLYQGNNVASGSTVIPVNFVESVGGMQIRAVFNDTMAPYTVTSVGRELAKKLLVTILNYGLTPLQDVLIKVAVNGSEVYSTLASGAIGPGESRTITVEIPVPLREGIYTVSIKASSTTPKVEASTRLYMIVLPEISVILSPLNSTQVFEGQRVCFKLMVSGLPSYVKVRDTVVVYSVDSGAPSTVYAEKRLPSGPICFTVPYMISDGRPVRATVKAIVSVSVAGLVYRLDSNSVTITVYPISSLASRIVVQLEPLRQRIYEAEDTLVKVAITPPPPLCIDAVLKLFSAETSSWQPLGSLKVCNGVGYVRVRGAQLGVGRHFLVAEVLLGPVKLQSNVAQIVVLPAPNITVSLSPKVAPPSSRVNVKVTVKPRPTVSYMVLVKPSWLPYTINATSSEETTIIPLLAPEKPGFYSVACLVNVDGYTFNRTCSFTVANITLRLQVTPRTVVAGEVRSLLVKIISSPAVNGTVIVRVVRGNETVYNTSALMVEGSAALNLSAPTEPGQYIVEAFLREYGVKAYERVNVERIVYGVTLTLNATKVEPRAPVEARVEVSPPPSTSVPVLVMVKRGGAWSVVASGILADGRARVVFHAPETEGVYQVKAVVQQLNAESNIVELQVTRGAVVAPTTQVVAAAAAVAAVLAIVWTLRAIRRR